MPDAPADWGQRAADVGDATDDVLDDFDVGDEADRRPPTRCRKAARDA